ncbi:MAG: hypothetical protein NC914_03380 [Candidatus Omnitrophica bacterium]|nr:hypothetical protein [Candidatus Omnitrophota bacterium]
MPSLRTIFFILILIALIMFLRPQIMRWVNTWRQETTPIKSAVDSSLQEFQRHDLYKREKKIEGIMDNMAK